MSDIYRAIADPTRRQILDELVADDGLTLFDICGRLVNKHANSSTRQAISQHLAVLEAAGLITVTRVGRTRVHTVDTTPLRAVADRWLA